MTTWTEEAFNLMQARAERAEAERDAALRERDEARSWHNAGTCPKCLPLRSRLEEAEGLLRRLEWPTTSASEEYPDAICPSCDRFQSEGHATGCALAAFLAPSPGDAPNPQPAKEP